MGSMLYFNGPHQRNTTHETYNILQNIRIDVLHKTYLCSIKSATYHSV